MANLPPCPACGCSGPMVRVDARARPVYRCPTIGCDVVEYDRDLILRRHGVSVLPAAPRRMRVSRAR